MVTKRFRRGNVFDPECPARVVLDRIGDKWTVLVVLLLADGPVRFTELRERIGGVAPKVLTQTLRRLERDGILDRTVYAEVPPRVEYKLTKVGQSLIEPIKILSDWAETNVGAIARSRERFDALTG